MIRYNSPFHLCSGLEVIIKSAPKLHSIGIALGVQYGAMDDPIAKSGMANLLQRTVYRADKDLEDAIAENGIEHRPFTDYNATVHAFKVPKRKVREGCDLMAAVASSYMITNRAMEPEKMRMIEENAQMEDDAGHFGFNTLQKIMFGDSRPSISTGGTNDTLERISVDDLKKSLLANYTGDKMVLSIYGATGFEPALNAAAEAFGDVNSTYSPRKVAKAIPVLPVKSLSLGRDGITQTKFSLGIRTRGFFDDNRVYELPALDCAVRILNERIYDEVREKRGLVYGAWAGNVENNGFGFITISGGARQEKMEEAHKVILEELQKMRDGEISQADLTRAKRNGRIEEEGYLDDTGVTASKIAYERSVIGDGAYMLSDAARKLNLTQLRKTTARYFNPDKVYSVFVEPKQINLPIL